ALLQYLRSSRFLRELFLFYGAQVTPDLVFQGIYLNLDFAHGFLMRGNFRAMGLDLCFWRNRAERGFIDRFKRPHSEPLNAVEESQEAVVVLLRHRVYFVIVTARASYR